MKRTLQILCVGGPWAGRVIEVPHDRWSPGEAVRIPGPVLCSAFKREYLKVNESTPGLPMNLSIEDYRHEPVEFRACGDSVKVTISVAVHSSVRDRDEIIRAALGFAIAAALAGEKKEP